MNAPLKGFRAYANWLLSNYEILVGASCIKARPLKLTFDPTNVCQLRCPLCPTGLQVQDRDKGHAQLEMFQRLLDQVGDYVFFIDFFNWGEPLLNPRVEEFIRLASSRKIVCSMSTNLSLPLTDDRVNRIVGSGLHEIIVSLDGASSETYSRYRRAGTFDLVYDNMRRILLAKQQSGQTIPLVTWQFLVFRFNEHEMDKARAMAADVGVDRLIFRPPMIDLDRYPLSASDREEISGWEPKSALFKRATSEGRKSRCGWHYMSSAINWDGTVAPCCTTFEKRDDFGAIGKDGAGSSYMSVVNNASFRAVRDRFAGRRTEPVSLVCETCPTPSIMDYHTWVNRQIVLFTAVNVLERLRGIANRRRSGTPRAPKVG